MTTLKLIDERQAPGYKEYRDVEERISLASSKTISLYEAKDSSKLVERREAPAFSVEIDGCVFLGGYSGNGVANRSRERPIRRYDGKQFMFSPDGYFLRSMMFVGDSLPNGFHYSTEGDEAFVDHSFQSLPQVLGRYVFLGTFHSHFGHALVESMTRLWILLTMTPLERARTHFVFFGGWGNDYEGPLMKILSLFDLSAENILICRSDVRFEKLVIPSPSWRPWNDWSIYLSPGLPFFFEVVLDRVLEQAKRCSAPKHQKIYLSRGRLDRSGKGFNKRVLDSETDSRLNKILSSAGYVTVYPEELDLFEQIRLIADANEICGPAGSAQHLAAFARNCRSQLIFTHEEFWMGSTDVVLVWEKHLELKYLFGKKVGSGPALTSSWTLDVEQVADLL